MWTFFFSLPLFLSLTSLFFFPLQVSAGMKLYDNWICLWTFFLLECLRTHQNSDLCSVLRAWFYSIHTNTQRKHNFQPYFHAIESLVREQQQKNIILHKYRTDSSAEPTEKRRSKKKSIQTKPHNSSERNTKHKIYIKFI